MRIFFLLLALVFTGFQDAQAIGTWPEFEKYVAACSKQRDAACIAEIKKLFTNESFWADVNDNYARGKLVWKETELQFNFSAKKGEEGDFQIVKKNGKLAPLISLSKQQSPFEILLTLNHEISHFAESEKLLAEFNKQEKHKDCVSAYQLALLKSESAAYRAEVYFWKTSPLWFKAELKRLEFKSRLLEAEKITYEKYYPKLEAEMIREPNIVVRRYVEMDLYPKCTQQLFN